jgi:hypothetical protein
MQTQIHIFDSVPGPTKSKAANKRNRKRIDSVDKDSIKIRRYVCGEVLIS